eukprot:Skav221848  [mRNA]  locus=scaffold1115:38502:51211:+ [translate_table: standard]
MAAFTAAAVHAAPRLRPSLTPASTHQAPTVTKQSELTQRLGLLSLGTIAGVQVKGRNYETNIRKKKGPAERKQAKITAKHLRLITLACKEGGTDPGVNSLLNRYIKARFLPVHQRLEQNATESIKRWFLPIAKNAQHIAEKKVYGAIFGAVCRSFGQTEDVAFHSRNIANQLECRLANQKWFETLESLQHGQVPEAIAMAELKADLQDELSEPELEADLNSTTEHVRTLWPWTSEVRKRHVQTLQSESYKFLKMACQGSPFASIQRVQKAVTWDYLQASLESKKKRILRKSLWKPRSGKKRSRKSQPKQSKKQK